MAAAAEHRPAARRRPRGRGPFSSLTRRILAVNVVALGVLVGGVLYLDQFRASLVTQRGESLQSQGEIIAGALGLAASSGPEAVDLDIEPARALLWRLTDATATRARLFNNAGRLVADTNDLRPDAQVSRVELPPPDEGPGVVEFLYDVIEPLLPAARSRPIYTDYPLQSARDYPEAAAALSGISSMVERMTADGTPHISVAIPVTRFRKVLGALVLSVEARDIDQAIRSERLAILEVFGVALFVTVLMSIFLASTIARPVHRLAEAAELVKAGRGRRIAIPDFSRRRDEIGDLSVALQAMTDALYARLDAIESFAADVAHELKNPLSSLRSAIETWSRTNNPDARRRLAEIIEIDVRRLDKLISEISDASRLDAEMARDERRPIPLDGLLAGLVAAYAGLERDGWPRFALTVAPEAKGLTVAGLGENLGRVFRNLIDNAISFSPPGTCVALALERDGSQLVARVEDEGPGIPEEALGRIFERFYTERPNEQVGSHSGLGLAIVRQIVEGHDGTIEASNRRDPDQGNGVLGACFTVRLPVAGGSAGRRRPGRPVAPVVD
ncbi:sensor histidine kinase [Zavarzinia compransoris]|uniref:histidine kinase n=1 Tax=Zavarzinia compransoris TaxID=1264899 RepID=A0A317E090_9PROT|nr:stimulus-sensing domain-containing protein [Zavarzinia compransoris]PWR18773.1 histidine kinase [Zavarzinia compransoris]TDP48757.1 two-component system sensor histidine kinase ChvG [Zavarzinia compransoris]